MIRMRSFVKWLALVGGACASTAALADNPLGFYAGLGAGYSTIRSDDPAYGLPGYFNDHQAAWKVFAGVRPIPFLGAELEYIDFGQPDRHGYYYDYDYSGYDTHPRSGSLFAVGYLPIPVPNFDVYAKAGVAHLDTDVPYAIPSNCSSSSQACPQYVAIGRRSETFNKLTYGAGVQTKIWNVSFRAEYERISSSFGDPDALLVGAAWNF